MAFPSRLRGDFLLIFSPKTPYNFLLVFISNSVKWLKSRLFRIFSYFSSYLLTECLGNPGTI